MVSPTARNVAPAGSEYAETVRSNHCTEATKNSAVRSCKVDFDVSYSNHSRWFKKKSKELRSGERRANHRKKIPYCSMRSESLSFEAAGRGSRVRRRPPKSHTCSIGDISGK
ncbi:hypothetical protein TNCV_1021551 [Trichonephila clavipes]|uniref:Uncharacterized protein n=1 Tax=Trichonephila clavipes TaxID=2585209 RepID=A0A8X6VPB8_TRICX|nr:hypothetical protein TNCV_1021551 [Trichonephila clavipes]